MEKVGLVDRLEDARGPTWRGGGWSVMVVVVVRVFAMVVVVVTGGMRVRCNGGGWLLSSLPPSLFDPF